jgi:hypothetical protein
VTVSRGRPYGHANTRLAPQQILTLIESIAVGWTITTAEFLADADVPSRNRDAERQTIFDSVGRRISDSNGWQHVATDLAC